jgi:predicted transposase YdaD
MQFTKETCVSEQVPHDVHDRGYKLLLSFGKIFQELMEGYVDADWKHRLDYNRSQRIDKTFILQGLEKQESDVLYKVPLLGQEKEIYLLVLIEHQSTIDYSLAFRILVYLTNVWSDIYKNTPEETRRQQGFRLPPVFPIVLYKGACIWTAARTLREIVDEGEIFGDYLPNVKYHLVDIARCDAERLKQLGNSLAGVFLLEHDLQGEEFTTAMQEALDLIDQDADEPLWRAIATWISVRILREMPDEAAEILGKLDIAKYDRKEIRSMLETMPKKLFAMGIQKGRQEGEQIGIQKEKREAVLQGLQMGLDVKTLHQLTKIPVAEIEKMRRDMDKN